jgi:nucleotide-binding universal stress UspA family protein
MTETYAPTFNTVLCAVDLSPHSQAALYLAAGLTSRSGSRLVVLLVDHRASGDDEDVLGARRELEQFVRGTLPGPPGYREGTDMVVRSGEPAALIMATAAETGAELVVIGSRGRGGISLALFGSTASALLRDTRVPLAIVPPTHPEILSLAETHAVPHFGIVVVPVDLRTTASRQMAFAARFSPGSEHHLLLVHVVPSDHDRESPAARLNALAGTVSSARGWRVLVKSGAVVDELASLLHHENAGLVVLGQSSEMPGKLAYELVRRTRAVVVMVP